MEANIKNKQDSLVFYIVSNMTSTLDAYNVAIINESTELYYQDLTNVSYQTLYNDRLLTMGGNHCGMIKKKSGLSFWVLPVPVEMGFTIKEGNTDITEYTYSEYIDLVWDIEEIE